LHLSPRRVWTRRALAALAVTLGLVLASQTAEAQHRRGRAPYDYSTRMRVYFIPYGVYLGAGLVATRVLHQSEEPKLLDDGVGVALYAGLRLSDRLALELGWLSTFHDPEEADGSFGEGADYLVLNGFTGDARIYLGQDRGSADLYLQGGVGLYLLDSYYFGSSSIGTGFQAGGGVDFHLGPHLDLGLRALYRGIAMGPPDADDDDTYVSAVGAEGNLTIRF
jgi:Outer membrane protein beta-barrel domain